MRRECREVGEAYLAVAFSSFGAIEPPSRILPDRAPKSAFPCEAASLGLSASCIIFGTLRIVPRPEVVKDSSMNPATTIVTRMEICRAIAQKGNEIKS